MAGHRPRDRRSRGAGGRATSSPRRITLAIGRDGWDGATSWPRQAGRAPRFSNDSAHAVRSLLFDGGEPLVHIRRAPAWHRCGRCDRRLVRVIGGRPAVSEVGDRRRSSGSAFRWATARPTPDRDWSARRLALRSKTFETQGSRAPDVPIQFPETQTAWFSAARAWSSTLNTVCRSRRTYREMPLGVDRADRAPITSAPSSASALAASEKHFSTTTSPACRPASRMQRPPRPRGTGPSPPAGSQPCGGPRAPSPLTHTALEKRPPGPASVSPRRRPSVQPDGRGARSRRHPARAQGGPGSGSGRVNVATEGPIGEAASGAPGASDPHGPLDLRGRLVGRRPTAPTPQQSPPSPSRLPSRFARLHSIIGTGRRAMSGRRAGVSAVQLAAARSPRCTRLRGHRTAAEVQAPRAQRWHGVQGARWPIVRFCSRVGLMDATVTSPPRGCRRRGAPRGPGCGGKSL